MGRMIIAKGEEHVRIYLRRRDYTGERMGARMGGRAEGARERLFLCLAGLATALWLPLSAPAQRGPNEERFQQMLQRFPDADLNKDGHLTMDGFREFRRKTGTGAEAASARPATEARGAPSSAVAAAPATGPVEIQVASGKPIPVNPRVYGIVCAEMFRRDLVDNPQYIAAVTELKFKTFLYPGGSASYYHHPKGTGGFNVRPEEAQDSAEGKQSQWMQYASGPDHFEQYIQLVKASGGEAVFVANVLNGTVDELDEFLSRLRAADIPIACVALGQEMHLGPARSLGLDGYVERIKPLIAMLQAKYPTVAIVAPATPVGRGADRGSDSFHEWNKALAKLPGISGFSQYGWTEFGGQPRLGSTQAAADERPDEIWRKYEEFVKAFPTAQIPTYQADWGADKRMYLTQWGTHADRNTPVQGLHIANFYFFMAEHNATHGDYFAAATAALNLAADVSKGARLGGAMYGKTVELLTPYLYAKPFRHLFNGDKKLLSVAVNGARNEPGGDKVKALAAVGPDGREYLYLLNSGPAVALGALIVDGETLPAGLRVQVESVFSDAAASAPVKSVSGEMPLRDLALEPWSLTLVIVPRHST